MQTFMIDDAPNISLDSYSQLIVGLLGFGQLLCKQTQGVGEQLCQEVARATQGKARLLLPFQDSAVEQEVPVSTSVSFQVQFNDRNYGTLIIAPDPENPMSPAIPLPVAHLLAHICSLLLSTIEMSVFIESQSQRIEYQNPGQLTRREREVLGLICRGHDQQTISRLLDITPSTVETYQKRISGKLGVHSERDIPLAAYRAGLCSIQDF